MAAQPDSLTLRFNRHLGYPELIAADPSYQIADDEIRYSVTDFKLLERTRRAMITR